MAEDLNINIRGGQSDAQSDTMRRLTQQLSQLNANLTRQNQQVQGAMAQTSIGRVQQGGATSAAVQGASEGIADNAIQAAGTGAVTGGVFVARQGGFRPAAQTVGRRFNQARSAIRVGSGLSRGARVAGSFASRGLAGLSRVAGPFAAISAAEAGTEFFADFQQNIRAIRGGIQSAATTARQATLFGRTDQGVQLGAVTELGDALLSNISGSLGGPNFEQQIEDINRQFRQTREQRLSQAASGGIRSRLRGVEQQTSMLGASPAQQRQQRLDQIQGQRMQTIRDINTQRAEGEITQTTQARLIERANEAYDQQLQRVKQLNQAQQKQTVELQKQNRLEQQQSISGAFQQQNRRLRTSVVQIGAGPLESARIRRDAQLGQLRRDIAERRQQIDDAVVGPVEAVNPRLLDRLQQNQSLREQQIRERFQQTQQRVQDRRQQQLSLLRVNTLQSQLRNRGRGRLASAVGVASRIGQRIDDAPNAAIADQLRELGAAQLGGLIPQGPQAPQTTPLPDIRQGQSLTGVRAATRAGNVNDRNQSEQTELLRELVELVRDGESVSVSQIREAVGQ
jgi:hypothetical protein